MTMNFREHLHEHEVATHDSIESFFAPFKEPAQVLLMFLFEAIIVVTKAYCYSIDKIRARL